MQELVVTRKPLEELLTQFLFVHSCWQDPKKSVKHKMSYDRAIRELREVRDQALEYRYGDNLRVRAARLLREIVKAPMSVDAQEVAV